MELCWVSCYDWTKENLLVHKRGGGKSFGLVGALEWGGGRTLSLEETESWMNVCAERLKRACHAKTGEGVGEDVAQVWTNEMGSVKWTGAQGGLDMQWEEVLQNVRMWLGEFDCLWLQQKARNMIEVGPAASDLFGMSVAGVLGTVWRGLVRRVPCLHLVLGRRCRWCLRFPSHLSALPL